MDKQAVFDTVARGLVAQGGPALVRGGCFYRTEDGRKCGVGLLIPDALYDPSLEDCDAADLPTRVLDALEVEGEGDLAFLTAMQQAHDSAARAGPEAWREAFRRIAAEHLLSPAALDTAD